MKKLLFLILPVIAYSLVSCNSKDNHSVVDSLRKHIDTYNSIRMYGDVALDPFNVAYRLNVYLEGGSTETLRSQLFPSATVQRSDDGQSYTLTYTELLLTGNDLVRSGDVVVHTYGTLLSEENAIWQVTTNTETQDLLYVYYPNHGYWQIDLDADEYVISNHGIDSYKIEANAIYLLDASYYTPWNWDLNLVVTQTSGVHDLAQARFRMETGEGVSGGSIIRYDTGTENHRYRIDILEPLLYSPECAYLQKSGGQERLLRMDNNGYKGLDSLIFDFGDDVNNCYPDFSLTAKAQADSVWTTHNYTWDETWIPENE